MPRPQDLPPELAGLANHHAVEIGDANFRESVTRLIEGLEKTVEEPGRRPNPASWFRPLPWTIIAIAIVIAVIGGMLYRQTVSQVKGGDAPAALESNEYLDLVVDGSTALALAATPIGAEYPDNPNGMRFRTHKVELVDINAVLQHSGGVLRLRPLLQISGGRLSYLNDNDLEGQQAAADATVTSWLASERGKR